MKRVTLKNLTHPLPLALSVRYCASFLCQLRGLTFRRRLNPDEGLLLVQKTDNRIDSAIHMLFVWIPLGVIWINSAGSVVDTCLALPWRPLYVPKQPARYVLEVHPSRLDDFCKGDHVSFDDFRSD